MLRSLQQSEPSSTSSVTPPPAAHQSLIIATTSLLIILLSFPHQTLAFSQYNIFIYAGCSQDKYQPSSPFEANRNSLLASLYTSSSQASYGSLAIGGNATLSSSSSSQDGTIYGLYQCRGDLSLFGCSRCIQGGIDQIGLACPNALGASLQLEGCLLRYDHVDFLGKLDTSVRYKKCSTRVSGDVDFFRRRDDVLADLQAWTTVAEFKVSTSGVVEGYAQCMGDLTSSGDCTACVAEAVGRLKSLCGSAAAAEVFLGQCYARYWAAGNYDFPRESRNNDSMGETVAIVIGVVAALAILIVALSICTKSMGLGGRK